MGVVIFFLIIFALIAVALAAKYWTLSRALESERAFSQSLADRYEPIKQRETLSPVPAAADVPLLTTEPDKAVKVKAAPDGDDFTFNEMLEVLKKHNIVSEKPSVKMPQSAEVPGQIPAVTETPVPENPEPSVPSENASAGEPVKPTTEVSQSKKRPRKGGKRGDGKK